MSWQAASLTTFSDRGLLQRGQRTLGVHKPVPVAVGASKEAPYGEESIGVGAHALAPGTTQVETKIHGGIHLSPERLEAMPEDERTKDSWYEEDCEAAFVFWRFREQCLITSTW